MELHLLEVVDGNALVGGFVDGNALVGGFVDENALLGGSMKLLFFANMFKSMQDMGMNPRAKLESKMLSLQPCSRG